MILVSSFCKYMFYIFACPVIFWLTSRIFHLDTHKQENQIFQSSGWNAPGKLQDSKETS